MTILFFLALFIFVLTCIVLVGLIMMQEGKGGGLSGVMGSSMGETFGFGGASKQIRKYTAVCATIFLVLTIVLTFLGEAAFKTTTSQFVGTTTAAPAAPGTNPADPAAPVATATDEAPAPGDPAAPRVITITPAAGNDASPGVVAPADPNAGPSVPSAPPAGTPAATPAS